MTRDENRETQRRSGKQEEEKMDRRSKAGYSWRNEDSWRDNFRPPSFSAIPLKLLFSSDLRIRLQPRIFVEVSLTRSSDAPDGYFKLNDLEW